jgi:hypothetical protein
MILLDFLKEKGGRVAYQKAVEVLGGTFPVDTQLVELEERSLVAVIENPATDLPEVIILIPQEEPESTGLQSEAA